MKDTTVISMDPIIEDIAVTSIYLSGNICQEGSGLHQFCVMFKLAKSYI